MARVFICGLDAKAEVATRHAEVKKSRKVGVPGEREIGKKSASAVRFLLGDYIMKSGHRRTVKKKKRRELGPRGKAPARGALSCQTGCPTKKDAKRGRSPRRSSQGHPIFSGEGPLKGEKEKKLKSGKSIARPIGNRACSQVLHGRV